LSYPNLVDVLSNTTTEPFDLKSFLDFTEGHWMDENVLFFLEVKAFKMAGGGEATYLTYIKRMHDIYIAPGSLREINISGEVHEATTTAVRSLLKEAAVPIMEHSSSGDPADSDSPSRGVSEPENNNDGIQEIVHPGVSSQPKPSGEPGVKQNEPLGACLQEDEQQQVTPMALQHLQLENEDQSVYSDIDG
ncbi:unnamed protein product, partial [Sphacelaria rigidula]